jgi:hypothetical protein
MIIESLETETEDRMIIEESVSQTLESKESKTKSSVS